MSQKIIVFFMAKDGWVVAGWEGSSQKVNSWPIGGLVGKLGTGHMNRILYVAKNSLQYQFFLEGQQTSWFRQRVGRRRRQFKTKINKTSSVSCYCPLIEKLLKIQIEVSNIFLSDPGPIIVDACQLLSNRQNLMSWPSWNWNELTLTD